MSSYYATRMRRKTIKKREDKFKSNFCLALVFFTALSTLPYFPMKVTAASRGVNIDTRKAMKALDAVLKDYDKRSTPTNELGVPTNVTVQIVANTISAFDAWNMDYETDIYLIQRWSDPRISHSDIRGQLDISGHSGLIKKLWKPETFFPNTKSAEFHYVTVPNVLIRIRPKGEIMYMLRLRLKNSCMMDLSHYPLDTQICKMQVSSIIKPINELRLHWFNDQTHGCKGSDISINPVSLSEDLIFPQFDLQNIITKHCHEKNRMGNYSCLVAEFHLQRVLGFHLIQTFLPSILIVVVSWLSFWINIDYGTARVTILGLTLLSITSLRINSSVPQTLCVKAIDVWMGVCTTFVFSALVEFTAVNYVCHVNDLSTTNKKKATIPDQIDKWSRIVFPGIFLLFNVIFWSYY